MGGVHKARWALGGVAAVLALVPLVVADVYVIDVMTTTLFYAVLALGLNVVAGMAGLLDLGYSAFFAIGAYTVGILTTQFAWSFWAALPVALVMAVIGGIIIGLPTLRLHSDYLAIVTLGFGEIIRIAAINLDITGGANGLYGIPSPRIGSLVLQKPAHFYYMALVLLLLAFISIRRLEHSRLGRAWSFVREDERAAQAVGINPLYVKLLAYIIGAVWGGLVGAVFATKISLVAPESFTFTQSVMVLLAVVLGGLGNSYGAVLGAAVVVALPEAFREFSQWRMFLFGLLLIPLMIIRPQGLLARRNAALPRQGGR